MKVQESLFKCHYNFHSSSDKASEQMWAPEQVQGPVGLPSPSVLGDTRPGSPLSARFVS